MPIAKKQPVPDGSVVNKTTQFSTLEHFYYSIKCLPGRSVQSTGVVRTLGLPVKACALEPDDINAVVCAKMLDESCDQSYDRLLPYVSQNPFVNVKDIDMSETHSFARANTALSISFQSPQELLVMVTRLTKENTVKMASRNLEAAKEIVKLPSEIALVNYSKLQVLPIESSGVTDKDLTVCFMRDLPVVKIRSTKGVCWTILPKVTPNNCLAQFSDLDVTRSADIHLQHPETNRTKEVDVDIFEFYKGDDKS